MSGRTAGIVFEGTIAAHSSTAVAFVLRGLKEGLTWQVAEGCLH